MAKEGQRSTASEKGKGKVDDVRDLNGEKKDAKDDKISKNGTKADKDDEVEEG
jgi:26S proteasome regulatory subunit N1